MSSKTCQPPRPNMHIPAGYAFWRVLSPKGHTILIVGPSNAGKTALFMRVCHQSVDCILVHCCRTDPFYRRSYIH